MIAVLRSGWWIDANDHYLTEKVDRDEDRYNHDQFFNCFSAKSRPSAEMKMSQGSRSPRSSFQKLSPFHSSRNANGIPTQQVTALITTDDRSSILLRYSS
jgi:hypothetical protein